jgi:hypothetical protein
MICRKIQTKRRPPIQRSHKGTPSRRGSRARNGWPAPGVHNGPLLEFLALPMPQDTPHLAYLSSYLLDTTLAVRPNSEAIPRQNTLPSRSYGVFLFAVAPRR